MFDIGVIALLVFGPSKLPELGRMFGRAMRELRRASDEFRSTVETNLHINDPEPFRAPPSPVSGESSTTSTLPSESDVTPAESASPAPASVTSEIGEPYCAQRGSRLFHRRECA